MTEKELLSVAGIRAELESSFVTDLGLSSACLYSLKGRRLSLVCSTHADPERCEKFEAVSSLTRGVALSTADLRAGAARSGRPQRDRYVTNEAIRYLQPESVLIDDLETRVAMPIINQERVLGVLMVAGSPEAASDAEGRFGSGLDFEWAQNLHGLEPEFGPVWRVEAMAELSSGLAAAASRNEMASEVLDAGLDALGATGGSLMLMTRPGVYELVQSRNIDRRLVDRWNEFAEVPGRDPFSDAIVDGEAQFFGSVDAMVQSYSHLWEDVAGTGHESWAVVPFSARPEGPVGALGAIFDTQQSFDRAQRITIRTVAHLAAVASVRVEMQRSQAQTLTSLSQNLLDMTQNSSASDNVKTTGYYQPAGDHAVAGGDWFDVLDSPNHQDLTYLVLGDVADHGPVAVGAMVAIRAWIQAAVHDGLEPRAIADKVGTLIDSYGYAVTTGIIARVDSSKASLTWCCAGHPYLLFSNTEETEYDYETHGPPLGAVRAGGADYRQSERSLNTPSSVVLYSDGLLQRFQTDFQGGLDALRATVKRLPADFSARDVVKRLSVPERFTDDDVAVLVAHLFQQGPVDA